MATQLQLRRGNNAQVLAFTPAAGEPAFNTTTDRLSVGDGSTAGGWPNALVKDVQNGGVTAAVDSGVADALAITLAPAPLAYAKFQLFWVQAANANVSQTPTLNVNALGPKTIQKSGGPLQPSDIEANKIYGFLYDGTNFQIALNIALPSPSVYDSIGGSLLVPFTDYLKSTAGGAIGDSLPASPSIGDRFVISDGGGVWGSNVYTVNANGNSINGSVQNMVGNVNYGSMQLTCIAAHSFRVT